uniref:Ig-like domain-containing protein n=1 Tax=Scleropages formosus TaxID=113540 RepID=A0A8C9VNX2_SCLFO
MTHLCYSSKCIFSIFFKSYLGSSGQNGCAIPCKKNVTVTGSLNSAVLLPCTFMVGDTDQITVAWSQDSDLVIFDKMKYIRFSNNKEGRLKVFPYMSNIGNFSVQLDNLQHFDQGSYCCQILNESNCITVKVNLQKHESGSRPQQGNETLISQLSLFCMFPSAFFQDFFKIMSLVGLK